MLFKETVSFPVTVYIAGMKVQAENSLRRQCLQEGLCVTITPTTFIYTGGAEEGVAVGFVNYPRFPKTPEEIWDRAERVALQLMTDLWQTSVLIQSPERTKWISRRPDDIKTVSGEIQ